MISPISLGNDDVVLSRIIRDTQEEGWREDDREFAEKQLRKIYSQELSKVMREKKYYILNNANREKIEDRIQRFYNEKISKISRMLEKSLERKDKLISDKVKNYNMNDKRWFHKKEEIKDRVKEEEKSMLEVAKAYRLKSETFWREREIAQRRNLREFSSKYHQLYNSNTKSMRGDRSATVSAFNDEKLADLLTKRKTRFQQLSASKCKAKEIDHRSRERELRTLRDNQRFQKMMAKINKIEKVQQKIEQLRKKESLQKAKMKLSQKIYKNIKPQIGEDCQKHSKHTDHFRSRTLVNTSQPSPSRENQMRASMSRSNSFYLQKQKREESLMRYYQKTRRLKITKLLKTNIRNVITSQFRSVHSQKDISLS